MNDTTEDYGDLAKVGEIVAIIVPIFFGLIAITGLLGNSLVIFVVIANQKMRSTTNLLISNLAVADLLFIVFCIPFTATDYALNVWPFGLCWCKIVQYFIVVTAIASIYTLVFMSLDRFLAVVFPVASKPWRTEWNTKVAILILWIAALFGSLPVPFINGLEEYPVGNETWVTCQFLQNNRIVSYPVYQITFMSSSYLLPLILISGLYVRMIARLWRSVAKSPMSRESRKGRRRVTRLVVVVVVAFASLWFPIQVILVLKSLDLYEADTTFRVLLQIISQILAYTSSCINPLLYAFLSENFRKAFHKAVHCSSEYRNYTCQATTPRRSSNNGTCATAI